MIKCWNWAFGVSCAGDDFMETALYGKPPYATHVYLPYYEGQMLLTRKCPCLQVTTPAVVAFAQVCSGGQSFQPKSRGWGWGRFGPRFKWYTACTSLCSPLHFKCGSLELDKYISKLQQGKLSITNCFFCFLSFFISEFFMTEWLLHERWILLHSTSLLFCLFIV